MKKRSQLKRQSPIKDKPLRNPGQSLDEELDRLISEEGLLWITTIVISIGLFLLEWWRWYSKAPPNPVGTAIVAILFTGFSVFKLVGIVKRARRLKMARDGEKAVGQYLTDLQMKGYRVFSRYFGRWVQH